MSKIVIIDTTINSCYVALTNNETIVGIKQHNDAKTQAAFINTAIEELLKESNTSFAEIDALACCMGPGSYTGLRIGLSTAKGLCYALDKPLIGFDRMEAAIETSGIILIKARVGEYFIAHYQDGKAVLAPTHMMQEDVDTYMANHSNVPLTVIGGEMEYSAFNPIYLSEDYLYPVDNALNIILEKYNKQAFEDVAYVEPMYLKSVYTTVAKKKSL